MTAKKKTAAKAAPKRSEPAEAGLVGDPWAEFRAARDRAALEDLDARAAAAGWSKGGVLRRAIADKLKEG